MITTKFRVIEGKKKTKNKTTKKTVLSRLQKILLVVLIVLLICFLPVKGKLLVIVMSLFYGFYKLLNRFDWY